MITLNEMLLIVGGKQLGIEQPKDLNVSGLSVHSKFVTDGSVFVPVVVKRNNVDNHKFIDEALAEGCAGCLTDRELDSYRPDKFYILVDDTVAAMWQLTKELRERKHAKVIAVTGSVGKTTTTDMIASVLSKKYKTTKTEKNLNDVFTAPKAFFNMPNDCEAVVLELGIHGRHELDFMSPILKPDIAVITNIGFAHVGNTGSIHSTLKAKAEIFSGMDETCVAVLNGDDSLLKTLDGKIAPKTVWYGSSDFAETWCKNVCVNGDSTTMEVVCGDDVWQQTVPLPGVHVKYAAMAAATVGHILGVPATLINEGIEEFQCSHGRMDVSRNGSGITVIDSSYNASPASMKAVVDVLCTYQGKRIAVLGDMLELGEYTRELHNDVGVHAAEKDIDVLICVGEAARFIYAAACNKKEAYWCPDADTAKKIINSVATNDSVFAFKASARIGINILVEYTKNLEL